MFIDCGRKLHANSMALALEIMTGKATTVLCVHCLNKADPQETRIAKRVGGLGYCYLCPYTDGPELFIVVMSTWLASLAKNSYEANAIDVAYKEAA